MVTVVGRKNSGKTTLAVRLVAELTRRGYRVMTIKHGSHTFSIDPATTDTWRHYNEGGAATVAMASPDKFALVRRWEAELGPEQIASAYMSDADVVICEGFKRSSLPRIEVFRKSVHAEPLIGNGFAPDATYIAVVTDDPGFRASAPVLHLDSAELLPQLADLVVREVMETR